MARKKTINSNQLSFDFDFDTEEEKQVAQYAQTIESIIDDLTTASTAEVIEVEAINQSYHPIVPDSNINDGNFLASSWLNDNLTAIKIANNYDKTNTITDNEKQLLLRYHGWGGLSEVFDERKYTTGQFAEARTELKELLTETEYRQARSTTLTAMYTPMEAVTVLQNGLSKLGAFDPNRKVSVLDPAAGTGRMFYNLSNIQPSLVELDPLTAKISAAIFGKDAVLNTGFEKSNVRDNAFDVVIANPPFGDFKVGDSQVKSASIHNYFMMKSINALRDGGVGAFVVSRYFLDGKDTTSREYIANKANLISAYRLPSGMFPDTEVVVDILFFQKSASLNKAWVNTSTIIPSEHFDTQLTNEMTINSYYLENTHNVLGQLEAKSNQYGDMIVTPMLAEKSKADIYNHINSRIETVFQPIVSYEKSPGITQLFGVAQETGSNPKVDAFIELKTILIDLLDAEQTPDLAVADLEAKRQLLNTKYDDAVAKYGYLNNKDNKTILARNNIEHITSLEEVTQQSRGKVTGTAKSRILNERVYHPKTWTITTPDEALMYSLNTTGRVDSGIMSKALNCSENEVIEPLVAEQKIFYNPATSDYDIAARYLSGNVVQKLEQAQQAGLTTNIEALTAIQPEIIPFEQIGISLSSPWLPPQTIKDFAKDNFDLKIDAEYMKTLGQWSVSCPRWGISSYVQQTYATTRSDFKNVLESTVAGRSITIYDTVYEDGRQRTVANAEETKKVQDCQQSVNQLFDEWINTIPLEKQRELESTYNYKFNNTVLPNYDGSMYKFSSDQSSKPLYPHQKNAIVRSLLEGRALYDHVVGAGKTKVMVSTLLEGKQIGLWKKPIVIVPNHLIAQWGKEIHEDYPGSNICLATVDSMASKNRKEFLSQIMTNDYDLIVMGHSHFKHIALDPGIYEKFIQTQIDELEASIASNLGGISVKQQQRALKGLESRLESQILKNKQNTGAITIDELGIDAIAVDEAHLFKNLAYTSVKQIAGLNDPKGSQRATDLLLKMHHIQEKYGRGTFLATGTPFSNSICEIYVMQKYLDNATLEQKGIASFDAWVDTFGEVNKNWEISSSGQGYQMKERLSSFKNCPELATMYRSFADVFTTEDLKNVGHIKVPTPSYEKDIGQPSEIQKIHFEQIIERVNKIQGGIDPKEDNMLKLTSFAKNSALDPRIIDSAYSDSKDSKVNNLVANVFNTYEATTNTLGTQVIFCDSSTPKEKKDLSALSKNTDSETSEVDKDDSITSEIDALAQGDSKFIIYDEIRSKLIAKGIEPSKIAFIHDYSTDKQKQGLYDQVNSGEVRVILGSTSKLGAGTNMQKKLVALHHLDVPWRPSDLIQREGRIIRQGNTNEDIKIHRYITEGTYDARSWQIIENKAKIAQQFTSSMDSKVRKIADVGMQTMNAAELKASATGNPYALYYVMLDQEINDLKRSKRSYENTQRVAQRFIKDNTHESIDKKSELRINIINQFEALRDNSKSNNPVISDEENNRLKKQLREDYRYSSDRIYTFTEYRGIRIKFQPDAKEFVLETGLECHQLRDKSLKYSYSQMEHFSPRVLFKDIDSILNTQLATRKQEVITQKELEHKDLDKFIASQLKPFMHQSRLTALEKDAAHCQNIIKELQKDSNYQESWIPESIKDSIKDDMLPKGYIRQQECLNTAKFNFVMSSSLSDKVVGINTNEDVLKQFEQFDKDNQIEKWREIGKIKTDTDFHYLENENPERVTAVLNQEFKTDITITEVGQQSVTKFDSDLEL
jgi:N12 class adenine-specific DNA methylase/predicted RNA methylase